MEIKEYKVLGGFYYTYFSGGNVTQNGKTTYIHGVIPYKGFKICLQPTNDKEYNNKCYLELYNDYSEGSCGDCTDSEGYWKLKQGDLTSQVTWVPLIKNISITLSDEKDIDNALFKVSHLGDSNDSYYPEGYWELKKDAWVKISADGK
jgi:hypothetical protein